MSWVNKIVKLGSIKQNQTKIIEFKSLKPLTIQEITPTCAQCTKIVGYKDNVLTVKFLVGEISEHLKINPGYQEFRKSIVITMLDGSKNILVITGKKIK